MTADQFDEIRRRIFDLGYTKRSGERVVTDNPNPLSNDKTTRFVIDSFRIDDPEEGARVTTFVEVMGAESHLRIVLPHSVVQAIVAQRERMFDRSTPESRKRRARSRELDQKRRNDHAAGRHAKRPVQSCPLCE